MASPRHPTTMENLPGHVLSEIFIRLLAKHLAQMRCICKSWKALLSESSFIKSHLHRSIHNNDDILLFVRQGFSFDSSSFTARPSRTPNLELTNFIKFPINPHSEFKRASVIGSVNGLICFSYVSYNHHVIGIWNPSLSALLTLPSCSLLPHEYEFGFGFGFDPKTDDYKVIKLTGFFPQHRMVPRCEVYSMRKGSWVLISQRFPSHITNLRLQEEVCVDGVDGLIHWLGYADGGWMIQTIVAFNLGAETFHEIPLPNSLHHHGSCYPYLGALAGKLCVMLCIENGECEVWVMEEYGVADSWVKHHVFSQFSGDITPYGITSHSEFLFRDSDRHFALYNPVADKTKTFTVKLGKSYVCKIVEYIDSLVWIEPAK